MGASPHIVVAGAGAIGCFVGGLLAARGKRVTLLGRARIFDELRRDGLSLSDFADFSVHIPRETLNLSEDAACLSEADIVLVTVKSTATASVAAEIAAHAKSTAYIVSLQNGMGNERILRAALPQNDIRAGMVPFNIVPKGQGRFHRATSGDIVIGAGPGMLEQVLSTPDLTVIARDDIASVQWGKLLVNLANALNALSGQPLRSQLMSRDWRVLMADQMAEGLAVLRAHGIVPVSTTPLPANMTPHILRLPTWAFTRIAAKMMTIDPQARASMAFDLEAGRPTEVDAMQGEFIRLAKKANLKVPICESVLKAVKAAERGGPQTLDPKTLTP